MKRSNKFLFLFISVALYPTKINKSCVEAAYFEFPKVIPVDSCKNYGINAGAKLEEECVAFCYPNSQQTFDYADNDEDPFYVVRNTICRCYETGETPDIQRLTFECTTKAEVWDKSKPVMTCLDDYEIDSLATCQNYCKKIDPLAIKYKGYSGNSQCSCGDIEVCNDIVPKLSSARSSGEFVVSAVVTMLSGVTLVYFS